MSTEIEKFDPSKLTGGIKDRIKATLASLIPDEQWEALINREVEAFFQEEQLDQYYRSTKKSPSQFRTLVWEQLKDQCREQVLVFLSTYRSEIWENNKIKVNERFKQLILDNAPEMFTNIIADIMQQTLNNMPRPSSNFG